MDEPSASAPETVILLHGMGRSRASLWVLQRRLRGQVSKTR